MFNQFYFENGKTFLNCEMHVGTVKCLMQASFVPSMRMQEIV